MAFDFLNQVKSSLMQNFAPEQGQTNSSGVNPLQNMGPSMPAAPQLPPQASPRDQLMPPAPEPAAPQSLDPLMAQMPQDSPLDNPGGISLQELLVLGIQSYMQQLLKAPQMPTPDIQTTPMMEQAPPITLPIKDQEYYQNNIF